MVSHDTKLRKKASEVSCFRGLIGKAMLILFILHKDLEYAVKNVYKVILSAMLPVNPVVSADSHVTLHTELFCFIYRDFLFLQRYCAKKTHLKSGTSHPGTGN